MNSHFHVSGKMVAIKDLEEFIFSKFNKLNNEAFKLRIVDNCLMIVKKKAVRESWNNLLDNIEKQLFLKNKEDFEVTSSDNFESFIVEFSLKASCQLIVSFNENLESQKSKSQTADLISVTTSVAAPSPIAAVNSILVPNLPVNNIKSGVTGKVTIGETMYTVWINDGNKSFSVATNTNGEVFINGIQFDPLALAPQHEIINESHKDEKTPDKKSSAQASGNTHSLFNVASPATSLAKPIEITYKNILYTVLMKGSRGTIIENTMTETFINGIKFDPENLHPAFEIIDKKQVKDGSHVTTAGCDPDLIKLLRG